MIATGVVVQRRQNGGQKRLLEQVGGQHLFVQRIVHRFGRFIVTTVIDRFVWIVLKRWVNYRKRNNVNGAARRTRTEI